MPKKVIIKRVAVAANSTVITPESLRNSRRPSLAPTGPRLLRERRIVSSGNAVAAVIAAPFE
jgi:hypothetical protein